MKTNGKTKRIDAEEKAKKRARFIAQTALNLPEDAVESFVKNHNNLKICSCPMCCNPRSKKSLEKKKKTIQERKIDISKKEYLNMEEF